MQIPSAPPIEVNEVDQLMIDIANLSPPQAVSLYRGRDGHWRALVQFKRQIMGRGVTPTLALKDLKKRIVEA